MLNPYLQLGGTIAAQLVIGVFIYGQLTQRVKDQGGWLKKHEERLDKAESKLGTHEGRISHIEGRKGIPHGGD